MADGRRGGGYRAAKTSRSPGVRRSLLSGTAAHRTRPQPEPLQLDEPEEERLPWLEDDDLVAERRGGGDTARLIGFALLGLLALAMIVGLLYWITNRGPDPALVADGGLIEAPEGPVKVRPDNPGGRTFEGTGDVAPGVGEGRTREARLAEEESAAAANARRAAGADGDAEADRFERDGGNGAGGPGRRIFDARAGRSRLDQAAAPDRRAVGRALSHRRGACRYRYRISTAGNSRGPRGGGPAVRRVEGGRGRLPGEKLNGFRAGS